MSSAETGRGDYTTPAAVAEILELLDQSLTLECEIATHAAGAYGCDPSEPGTYLIEYVHKCPGLPDRHPFIICQSKQIWMRGRLDMRVHCVRCRKVDRLGDVTIFHGKV